MTRAIKIDTDRTFEVIDLKPYPHLMELVGDHFDICFLNGPIATHPNQVTVGIAVDDTGLIKEPPMEINRLATSLMGVFMWGAESPLVGPAVVIGSDWEGENVDVPDWCVELVRVLKKCTDEAHKHFQNPEFN